MRVLVALDSGLLEAQPDLPDRLNRYGRKHAARLQLVAPPFVVRGGEVCKREPQEVEQLRALVDKHHLCRQSFVLAIGGGAVLDAVGYAAATAHRGVRLLRMPSTVLAQNDAGIGVKNGINAFGKKNFLGTFAPPHAVLNDLDLLATLPPREARAGIAEAVKVALIKDAGFFDWLYRNRSALAGQEPDAVEHMVVRCAELHLEHIRTSGDPFELGSARPLDFGHWSAHKLEELSRAELRHGEAVAIGVALDSLYAGRVGLISRFEVEKILLTLDALGLDLFHWALPWMDVAQALREFQEHLGGELTVTLPQGVGRRVEVHHMEIPLVRECIAELERWVRERKERRDEQTDLPPGGQRGPGPLLSGESGSAAGDRRLPGPRGPQRRSGRRTG